MEKLNEFSFSMISVNVRGLRKYVKRRKLYNWLCKHGGHNGLSFLQETHSIQNDEIQFGNQWKGHTYFSHGNNQSRGTCILVGDRVDFTELHSIKDPNGRYVLVYCSIGGSKFLLINSYAPNLEEEQIVFFRNLYDSFLSLDVDVNTYIIWGGDFNCHLDKEDADGGAYRLKIKSINIINTIIEDLELTEIWRVRNPNVKRFTWRTKSPLLQRRLDYYLISSQLQFAVTSCDIIPAVDTDHSAITLKLKSLPDVPKGSSHWHFNNSLVKDETYIQLMRENIGLWIQEFNDEHKDNKDARKLWEFLKYKIRTFTTLEAKVNQLESSLTGNTNTALRKEYDDGAVRAIL